MARIRSVKPEFWDDEAIGLLSRDARLLYIATWNMADDEGLLRWTASYIKANAFMYDDDLGVAGVTALMAELAASSLIRPYTGGKARQSLAWVVQFGKHQKPNRPQASKLPPPSIQNGDVIQAYIRRDHGTCHLCGQETNTEPGDRRFWPSLDHVLPLSKGGTDYPSNVRLSHLTCNTARGNRPMEDAVKTPVPFTEDSLRGSVNDSMFDSVPDSVTRSPLEGRGLGVEGTGGEGKGGDCPPAAAPLAGLVLIPGDRGADGTAAAIVSAYVDACREVGQIIDPRAKGRIAKEAAQLLKDGAPHAVLVDAACRLAANGFADLGAEARRVLAQPRPATGRIAEGDEILREAFNRGQAQRLGQQELGA